MKKIILVFSLIGLMATGCKDKSIYKIVQGENTYFTQGYPQSYISGCTFLKNLVAQDRIKICGTYSIVQSSWEEFNNLNN